MKHTTLPQYIYAFCMLPLSLPLAIFAWIALGIADHYARELLGREYRQGYRHGNGETRYKVGGV